MLRFILLLAFLAIASAAIFRPITLSKSKLRSLPFWDDEPRVPWRKVPPMKIDVSRRGEARYGYSPSPVPYYNNYNINPWEYEPNPWAPDFYPDPYYGYGINPYIPDTRLGGYPYGYGSGYGGLMYR